MPQHSIPGLQEQSCDVPSPAWSLCQQDGVGGLCYVFCLCFSFLLREGLLSFQQPLGVMKHSCSCTTVPPGPGAQGGVFGSCSGRYLDDTLKTLRSTCHHTPDVWTATCVELDINDSQTRGTTRTGRET